MLPRPVAPNGDSPRLASVNRAQQYASTTSQRENVSKKLDTTFTDREITSDQSVNITWSETPHPEKTHTAVAAEAFRQHSLRSEASPSAGQASNVAVSRDNGRSNMDSPMEKNTAREQTETLGNAIRLLRDAINRGRERTVQRQPTTVTADPGLSLAVGSPALGNM